MKKTYALLVAAVSSSLLCATCSEKKVLTFINQRSASVNAARELVGWERLINIFNHNKTYATLAIALEATKSFRPERIAQCLFGDDVLNCSEKIPTCCPKHVGTPTCCDYFQPCLAKNRNCQSTFLVAGSQSPHRTPDSWLADYFGLPTDYASEVNIKPQANNLLADIDLYIGFTHGLYFRIHAPVVHTWWNLNLCESICVTGTNNYSPGYFNANGVQRNQLVDNFVSFIHGCDAPDMPGVTFEPLTHAKMSTQSLNRTSLSEIQAAFGWNFLLSDDYHLGINVRTSIPAGNRPEGIFLFEPMVGNGRHWEAGVGISGHILAINHEDTQEQFVLHGDINITHVFTAREKRSFDLKNKPNSRYMLAAKFSQKNPDNLRGNDILPTYLFAGTYAPVANLTTYNVDVHVGTQVDLALMMSYIKERASWNIGYGFWARSCEEICLPCKTPFDADDTAWVLKGDAHMYGFMSADDMPLQENDAVALSASQSEATLHSGTNFPHGTTNFEPGKQNPNIDNPTLATAGSNNTQLVYVPDAVEQINTSINPVIITKQDIDVNSARARYVAQKLFMHFSYTFIDDTHVKPYLGIGAEVDFGRSSGYTPPKELKKCINAALSYWGVWVKGGFAFR